MTVGVGYDQRPECVSWRPTRKSLAGPCSLPRQRDQSARATDRFVVRDAAAGGYSRARRDRSRPPHPRGASRRRRRSAPSGGTSARRARRRACRRTLPSDEWRSGCRPCDARSPAGRATSGCRPRSGFERPAPRSPFRARARSANSAWLAIIVAGQPVGPDKPMAHAIAFSSSCRWFGSEYVSAECPIAE